ncbi:MAG: dihydrofolate reductase [Oscillospiraceae bacterium]|nr:dihydrofolate reductase [Oscillospiraceae bacterium]
MDLIVSVDRNWGIGKNGKLLFSIAQDMEFFKDTTLNKAVVMGRKTLDSLPDGKPLRDRVNIVLTRDGDFRRDGVIVCNSLEELLDEVKKYPEVYVAGGGEIYKLLLPYCDRAYVTKISAEADADTHMVNLDNEPDWITERSTKDFTHEEFTYRFFVYERVRQK